MSHYPKSPSPKVPGKGEFSRTESHQPGTLHGHSFTKVGSQVGYVKKMPGLQSSPLGGRPSSHMIYRHVNRYGQ